jgi:hypothetical protein
MKGPIVLLTGMGVLMITGIAFSAGESLMISTYYPSPYGSYNEMRTNKLSVGELYNNPAEAIPDNSMIVQGDIRLGNANQLCDATWTGAIRYDDATATVEYCNGSQWSDMTSQGVWCGLSALGALDPQLCKGHDPRISCPAGYIQTYIAVDGGTWKTGLYGATTHYACIKD